MKLYFRNLTAANPPTAGEKSSTLPLGSGVGIGAAGNESLALKTTAGPSETTVTNTTLAQTAQQSVYMARFTSDPLAAQTFGSGTWQLFVEVGESAAAANAFTRYSVYVWRPSNSSVVGYIYDAAASDTGEWSSSSVVGNSFLGETGSNVTCQAGDVLVVEVWAVCSQGNATSRTLTLAFDGTTDVVNAVDAASAASYINTPADITFQSGGTSKDILPGTETDSAQAVSFTKTIRKTLGVGNETDAAQVLSVTKTIFKSLGVASEADFAAGIARLLIITAATETDSAQPLSFTQGEAQNVDILPGSETDAAQSLSVTKTIFKTLGVASETDSARTLSVTKTIFEALGVAAETDSAQALTFTKTIHVTLGVVSESDAAVLLSIAGAPVAVARLRMMMGVGQ